MEKAKKCPVAIIRDYSFNFGENKINDLIRPENEDIFR
jgi:F420-0:gamma-glutamyl ligase